MLVSDALHHRCDVLELSWIKYCTQPSYANFVEFSLGLLACAEQLSDLSWGGLALQARELEQSVLELSGNDAAHPISALARQRIDGLLIELLTQVGLSMAAGRQLFVKRRASESPLIEPVAQTRQVWFIGRHPEAWQELLTQLGYFGVSVGSWAAEAIPRSEPAPTTILFDVSAYRESEWQVVIRALRQRAPASHLIGLGLDGQFNSMHKALMAGCDVCMPPDSKVQQLIRKLMDITKHAEEEPYRVLIVDDSAMASKVVQHVLKECQIDSQAIADPREVLFALKRYRPDLILLDMHMPGCSGIEAARVIRQHAEFLSTPIVYLSGETDIGLQVEALRLGGDDFLTKPFNPLLFSAIVKSKIERYRAMRRSILQDSLTGLLNHTSSKQAIDAAIHAARANQCELAVAMVDIDHFKSINDRFGHPAGDQIIRALAWLLQQRLRRGDVIGRYGGEEFIVALPGASGSQAQGVLDRIRADFARILHPVSESTCTSSFSCGVASFPMFDGLDSLVNAADEALYEAKHAGRNQVVLRSAQPHGRAV